MRINEHNFAADLVDACRASILRVAFTRSADLTLDIIAMHFDVAAHPRRELVIGSLTRIEAQRFIAAIVAFLTGTTDTSEMADRPGLRISHDSPAWLGGHDAAH